MGVCALHSPVCQLLVLEGRILSSQRQDRPILAGSVLEQSPPVPERYLGRRLTVPGLGLLSSCPEEGRAEPVVRCWLEQSAVQQVELSQASQRTF